jgi:hypothetical protein
MAQGDPFVLSTAELAKTLGEGAKTVLDEIL